jgi:hypothetical protein
VAMIPCLSSRISALASREELGRWLLGQDRRAEAEALLEQARQTYRQIGAVGWLRELDRAVGVSSTSTTLTTR